MIETQHLIEFTKLITFYPKDRLFSHFKDGVEEYKAEIVARLRAFDKLIEALEKMVERLGEK